MIHAPGKEKKGEERGEAEGEGKGKDRKGGE